MAYKTRISVNKIIFNGHTTINSASITGIVVMSSLATSFEVGNLIKGDGIPSGARILTFNGVDVITLTMNATATSPGPGTDLTALTDELTVKNADKLDDMEPAATNTVSTVVNRDASGNFAAQEVTTVKTKVQNWTISQNSTTGALMFDYE